MLWSFSLDVPRSQAIPDSSLKVAQAARLLFKAGGESWGLFYFCAMDHFPLRHKLFPICLGFGDVYSCAKFRARFRWGKFCVALDLKKGLGAVLVA